MYKALHASGSKCTLPPLQQLAIGTDNDELVGHVSVLVHPEARRRQRLYPTSAVRAIHDGGETRQNDIGRRALGVLGAVPVRCGFGGGRALAHRLGGWTGSKRYGL